VGKSLRKHPVGRPRRRYKDNINMDIREVGFEDFWSMELAKNRVL
jgi:hypothetical protein